MDTFAKDNPMQILIRWKEDFNLNIKIIDQHHRKLVDMINVLYNAFIDKEDDKVIEQTLQDVMEYAFIHFKQEERYFEQCNYADAPEHIACHQSFVQKAKEFRCKYMMNSSLLTQDVLEFLRDWLTNHILQVDKKYANAFRDAGIK
jgi:hemerythrin